VVNLERLVIELCKLPAETQWLEFKHGNFDPEMVGKDISALANGAALLDKNKAYMVWGIDDVSHSIIGTDKNLQNVKCQGQELESFLRVNLSKNASFEFGETFVDGKRVVVLVIDKAHTNTVQFKNVEYIRVGSYTKQLNQYPAMQADVWDKIRAVQFELLPARQDLETKDALSLLDFTVYFDNLGLSMPSDQEGIMHYLLEDEIVKLQDNGLYSITNMGAMLFCKRLSDFPELFRKAVRVVLYEGNNRLQMLKEFIGTKGYVVGFVGLINFIEALIPTREEIHDSIRMQKTAFPLLAIRELVANALIHQNFMIKGTGPVIEIFSDRIEITNPGSLLVDAHRIIDNPPKSRNEKLASLMRRLKLCEELGTGWDKVVLSCEMSKLPAPKIDIYEDSVRVTMFSYRNFSALSMEEKIYSCYMHACILYVQGEQLTNSSLRERFGLPESSAASISRLIKAAKEASMIKPLEENTSTRLLKYIPIWA